MNIQENDTQHIFAVIIVLASCLPVDTIAKKTEKIRLTGSLMEPVLLTVGTSGRTEVIQSLPYTLEVLKSEMPVTLKFQSDNYLYYDINVPKKPFDDAGHVYLVKIDERRMSLAASTPAPTRPVEAAAAGRESVVNGIDVTYGVNRAPLTGRKNDKAFALIIANEEYEYVSKVENATGDGLALKEYCIKTFGMPADNVRYVSNLTYGKMRKALNDILSITELLDGEASLLVYYAGHGIPDNKTKGAYLLPVDADGKDPDICFPLDEFYGRLSEARLSRCVVLLDACFSGASRDGDMLIAARGVKIKPREAEPQGNVVVFNTHPAGKAGIIDGIIGNLSPCGSD